MTVPVQAELFKPDHFFDLVRRRLRAPEDVDHEATDPAVMNPDFVPPKGFVSRDAAVLIPVVERETAMVLMTRRTAHLRKHAGQIAFPGGTIDPTDSGPVGAALREAREEIGLDPALVEPVGCLDPYIAGTGYKITGVVARVSPDHRLLLNPDEVDAAFEVPLAFLMTPGNHRRGSREWQGTRHFFYEMPYDDHYIWGVTAGIIRGLYERLFH